MKTFLEYLQKGHIKNEIKSGNVTPEKLNDGDYFVLELDNNVKHLFDRPLLLGKFKYINNIDYKKDVLRCYFAITLGSNGSQTLKYNVDCGISSGQLRYPTEDEIDELEYIENKIQPKIKNINNNDANVYLGNYNYINKTIDFS